MRVRMRLLPITIFVATLMLSVKAGGLWNGIDHVLDGMPVSKSNAATTADDQAKPAAATEAKAEGGSEPEPEAAADPAKPAGAADVGEAKAETSATTGHGEAAAEGEAGDETSGHGGGKAGDSRVSTAPPAAIAAPTETEAESLVLAKLKNRREELDRRAQALDLREQTVRAAEHTLQSRIDEYQRLKTDVETLLRTYDEAQEKELQTLAIYYEKMKPKDAARVFDSLEMVYLVDIIRRMKESKVAEIIGRMETAKAEALTTELAKKPDLSTSAAADQIKDEIVRN